MESLEVRFEDLADYIAREIRKEQNDRQGHRMTGRLASSTQGKVRAVSDGVILEVVRESYGEIIDNGVNRRRIPYSPGSGARSSKYIQGLLRFVKLRNLQPRPGQTQLGIAFAIARKHKQVGLPTPNSRRFSKTGRRTGALREVIDRERKFIRENVELEVMEYIEEYVFDYLRAILSSPFVTVSKIAA